MSPTRAVALALLLAACGGGTLTGATALELPAAVQARYPDCTLAGWTLERRPTPFAAPGSLCGKTPCTGLVRGNTNVRRRTITVGTSDPAVFAWEACNACRWEQTGVIRDGGCA